MEKQEILQKVQAENKDEMEIYINPMLLVFILTEILAVVFAINSVISGGRMTSYLILVSAPLGAGFLFRYIKTKKNFNLIMFIVCVVLTAGFLTAFALKSEIGEYYE